MDKISTFEIIGRQSTKASKTVILNVSAIVASIVFCILAHFIIHPLAIPAQAALYLEYGRLIVENQTPYIQFYDYTYPLVMYISAIPSLVSVFVPFHPIYLFNIFVLKTMALSLIVLGFLLFSTKFRDQATAPYILIGFALANLVFLSEFGQIHHLMLLYTFPYFVSRIISVQGISVDIRILGFAGAMAAFGFGLDPLFLCLFVLFEICLALERGRIDTICSADFSCCLVLLVVFGIYWITQQEQMGIMYLGLPFNMMMLDYEVWNGRISYFSTTPDLRNLVYFAILSWVLAMGFSRYCRLLVPFCVLSIWGFGIFVIQGKSLSYQTLPMIFPAIVIMTIVLGIILNFLVRKLLINSSNFLRWHGVVIAAILLLVYLSYQISGVSDADYISLSDQGYIGSAPKSDLSLFSDYIQKNTKVGDKILVINDQVIPAYPLLLQLGRSPGSGFLNSRLLKIARRVRYARPPEVWAKTVVAENDLWQKMKDDINRGKMDLILINENSMKPALDEKEITQAIESNYVQSGYLEWDRNNPEHMKIEYLGQRTSFHIYKPKNKMSMN